MKNILRFVSWQWNKWEQWQKVFITVTVIGMIGFLLPDPVGTVLISIQMLTVLGYLFKWAIWDSVKKSYAQYQKERSELFTKIKDSDRDRLQLLSEQDC